MAKFIQFEDIDQLVHMVNVDYIVQLHTKRHVEWDRSGDRLGERLGFYVNVANAGVACYNAEDIEVSTTTYKTITDQLQ